MNRRQFVQTGLAAGGALGAGALGARRLARVPLVFGAAEKHSSDVIELGTWAYTMLRTGDSGFASGPSILPLVKPSHSEANSRTRVIASNTRRIYHSLIAKPNNSQQAVTKTASNAAI